MMELYILAALLFIYIITVVTENKMFVRRIWTIAFIISFVLSSVSLLLLRFSHQDVMMTADNFNWYYALYVFGALSIALGIINLWIYRGNLYDILSAENNKE